jgi:hypothetical protein
MKWTRKAKPDLACLFMGCVMTYAAILAPNGSSPSCHELWCILLVKGAFAYLAYVFFEQMLFWDGWSSRLFCRILCGEKFYRGWLEEVALLRRKRENKEVFKEPL